MLLRVICLFILLLPVSAQASVTINEIAWMGDSVSANHEWIELYNDSGEDVSVDGWLLTDNVNLNINSIGTIPAHSYVVLERTSEESSPASAFMIYTGALVNTGVTLTLKNKLGEIVDQVVGGADWQDVGGDNVTKYTAQYSANKGWITASPTPGAKNSEDSYVESNNSSTTEDSSNITENTNKKDSVSSQLIKKGGARSVSLVTSNAVLKLQPDMQDVAYVNQTIPFSVSASGVGENIISSLVYTWNFGDSFTEVGKKVEHAYSYPGTYVVTLNAKFSRHDETMRRVIKVLPITFSITENEKGDINIHNDSPYDVDISGFTVKGEKTIVLPPKTIILPKATITIAKNRLGLIEGDKFVVLYDMKGNSVASNFSKLSEFVREPSVSNKLAQDVFTKTNKVSLSQSNPLVSSVNTIGFSNNLVEEALASEEIFTSTNTDYLANLATATTIDKTKKTPVNNNWSYVVFIFLLIVVLGIIFWSKR